MHSCASVISLPDIFIVISYPFVSLEVAVDVIKQSKIVWQMLQDLGSEDSNDEIEALPIPNVNYAILKKIISWCE